MIAILLRLLVVGLIALGVYLGGRGFGFGAGGGLGGGGGSGGGSGQPQQQEAHNWIIQVSGEAYQLNGKPISLADLRSALEKGKPKLLQGKEAVHLVIHGASARFNAVKAIEDALEELQLPVAKRTE